MFSTPFFLVLFLFFQLHASVEPPSFTYEHSGVNIESGNAFVEQIKPLVERTVRADCGVNLGSFGGLCDLAQLSYKDPILVSSTDGVGTKVKLAQQVQHHDGIGIDLVAMCVNDVLAQGAEPIFFLDYFATGKLHVPKAVEIVASMVRGCQEANCVLIGGETAEMPGMYQQDEYDLAGFVVGMVERQHLLPKLSAIKPGDVLIGVASSGVHANGFSLIRYLIDQHQIDLHAPPPFTSHYKTLYEELLQPTKIYVKSVLPLIKTGKIKAIAHITGGGLLENIPRIIPKELSVEFKTNAWPILPVFYWIAQLGNVSRKEMMRTFNMGIGMLLIVAEEQVNHVLLILEKYGEQAYQIGKVIAR